jgi:serine/threonine protein phosphatase 1
MSATFVIADIHGRSDLLRQALNDIQSHHSSGKVVFLGDYIDRGPDSKGVLDVLIAGPPEGWEWVCLKGNHEDMCSKAMIFNDQQNMNVWLGNGGFDMMGSYPGKIPHPHHLAWMHGLPVLHQDKYRVYVHAYVDEYLFLDKQNLHVCMWSRFVKGIDSGYLGRYVVHGHTPNLRGPEVYTKRCNLDTGAVYSGRLVVAVFDDDVPGPPVLFMEVIGPKLSKTKGYSK